MKIVEVMRLSKASIFREVSIPSFSCVGEVCEFLTKTDCDVTHLPPWEGEERVEGVQMTHLTQLGCKRFDPHKLFEGVVLDFLKSFEGVLHHTQFI